MKFYDFASVRVESEKNFYINRLFMANTTFLRDSQKQRVFKMKNCLWSLHALIDDYWQQNMLFCMGYVLLKMGNSVVLVYQGNYFVCNFL